MPEAVLSGRLHAFRFAACRSARTPPPARTISDLFPADVSGVARGATRNGATDFEYRSDGRRTYGYWMTHSVFGMAEELGTPMTRFGFAGGDLTGSRPPANATWTGRMVGTAVEGATVGTRLAGDATLSWSAVDGTLDVAIGNIRDNANGNAWSVGSVRFDDVPVGADGTFGSGASGDNIRGGFHDSNLVEAAGTFEKRGIVGGFGARRE